METTDQEELRMINKAFYQKIYNEQTAVTPTQEDIKDFLQTNDDITPWEALSNRRIPEEMAETMEGDLTLEDLNASLFMYMNGNSILGLMGLQINIGEPFGPR